MIYLYHGGGSGITEIGAARMTPEEWARKRSVVSRLLLARRHEVAAALLNRYPFEFVDADNEHGDAFTALRAILPLDDYVALEQFDLSKTIQDPFRVIADTVSEVCSPEPYVRFIVVELDTENDNGLQVSTPSPRITSASVDGALRDAELLLRSRGAGNAIDRVHTAVHGYLLAAIDRAHAKAAPLAPATALFKQLRESEPRLRTMTQSGESSSRIVMALASILDATNTLRNNASAAHPTGQLLETAEAMLVINAARSLIHYLDSKLSG